MLALEQNKILQKIGEFILNSQLNENWSKAVLKIALVGRSTDFNLTFIEGNNEINTKLQGAFFCSMEIAKLHELTADHPNFSEWNRATYKIYPPSTFNIEYSWDQELQDELNRVNSGEA